MASPFQGLGATDAAVFPGSGVQPGVSLGFQRVQGGVASCLGLPVQTLSPLPGVASARRPGGVQRLPGVLACWAHLGQCLTAVSMTPSPHPEHLPLGLGGSS